MADDEWSALDEELEKALSGKKGKKGKRDSVLSSARATDLSGSSATGSEPAKPSGTKSLDDPSAVASTAYVPPAATARDPAPAPNETLDEWSALDEELEKLERGKKRRGVKNDGGGVGVGVGVVAAHRVSSTEPHTAAPPHTPPVPSSNDANARHRDRSFGVQSRGVPVPALPRPPPPEPSPAVPASDPPRFPDLEPEDASSYGRSVSAHIVGTCDEMCPERERVFRERERELDVFERVETAASSRETGGEVPGANRKNHPAPATSASLCVKRYARIVDDPSPDTVRTRSALERTTRHLYSLLGGRADAPSPEWEKVGDAGEEVGVRDSSATGPGAPSLLARRASCLWDRLRGVRQDIALQNWSDAWVTARLEEMVRFAIATEYLLCEDAGAERDAHLRREQLAKTLATLTRCYRDARDAPTRHRSDWGLPFPNEPEMLCYQLLLRLGAARRHNTSAFGETCGASSLHFSRVLRGAPPSALRGEAIAFALKAKRAHDSGNAATFLRLMASKECSYLRACCLHEHVNGARVHALRVASATWNKTDADLFRDVGTETLRLDARFVLDESPDESRIRTTQNDDVTEIAGDEKKIAVVRRGFADSRGRDSRARVTAAAAAMARACGLAVDEAAGTAALRRSPFVDPRDAPSSTSDGGVARDAFRPRRERFIDAKAPTAKGGFFRWRALIEGKAGR
jgi:hypothetical protein